MVVVIYYYPDPAIPHPRLLFTMLLILDNSYLMNEWVEFSCIKFKQQAA